MEKKHKRRKKKHNILVCFLNISEFNRKFYIDTSRFNSIEGFTQILQDPYLNTLGFTNNLNCLIKTLQRKTNREKNLSEEKIVQFELTSP